MNYWLIINNSQAGPYTLEQLRNIDFSATTPAWRQGLPEWIPASDIPELDEILIERMRIQQQQKVQVIQNISQWQPDTTPQPVQQSAHRPSNHLAWAIAVTLLCCMPLGIIAIFYSVAVNNRFDRGDVAGAYKASNAAQIWIILAVTLGLIALPFQIIWAILL